MDLNPKLWRLAFALLFPFAIPAPAQEQQQPQESHPPFS